MLSNKGIKKNNWQSSIFTIAIPIIINGIIQQAQILVDRAFLGRINPEFFSALGNAFFPLLITMVVIWSLTTGTTILITQNIGAKKMNSAINNAESSIKFISILSFILFGIWFFWSKQIFIFLGVKEPILEYSIQYAHFFSFSFLVLGIEHSSGAILQGMGFTKPLMIVGIVKNLLNIILDWLLIYGNWGFPKMGIEGAAFATTLSNFLTTPIFLLYIVCSKKLIFKISIFGILKAKWHHFLDVVRIGIPASLEEILWHVGNIILIAMLNQLDLMATGIYTLITGIALTPFFIYNGIARSATILIGRKTGEKNLVEARSIGSACLKYALATCVIVAIVFILLPKIILGMFTDDESTIILAIPFLIIISITFFPKAINSVVGSGIRGLGKTNWMLFSQIIGTIMVILFSILLIFIFNLKLYGLFIALFLDETIRAIINSKYFLKESNKSIITEQLNFSLEEKL